ncbi:MAG: hypothetical protein C4297_06760 [Gemmataceae bacterium]
MVQERVRNKVAVRKILEYAERRKATAPPAAASSLFEQVVYALCRENAPRSAADQAFDNLRNQFFDWNEVRVSKAHEVAAALQPIGENRSARMLRARRIVRFLQKVFDSQYTFDLAELHNRTLKQAQRQLERLLDKNEFAVYTALRIGFGVPTMPVDATMRRVLERLRLVDKGAAPTTLQEQLQSLVPEAKRPLFCEALDGIAWEYCGDSPACQACCLNGICPTGRAHLAPRRKQVTRSSRSGGKKTQRARRQAGRE